MPITHQHHELTEGQLTAVGIIAMTIIVSILVIFA